MHLKYLFMGILSIVGCSTEKIEGFDSLAWKKDSGGCDGKRKEYVNVLKDNRSLLIDKSESFILDIFGKPNQNELDKRNKKVYTYYVTNPTICDEVVQISKGEGYIQFWFNALGRSKEIYFINLDSIDVK